MRHIVLGAGLVLASLPAAAIELDVVNPDQAAFREVSEDLVAALSYKTLQPAEATGITGFGLGVSANYMETKNPQAWESLTGEAADEIGTVGLTANKGLPLGIDVGAFYAVVPDADAGVWGARLQWSVWQGSAVTPGVALRGTYTAETGVDDFGFSSYSVDAAISKGFAMLTPYAGVGYLWGEVDPDVPGLEKEEIDSGRLFVGLRISTLLLDITPEYESIDGRDLFNLRFGLSF